MSVPVPRPLKKHVYQVKSSNNTSIWYTNFKGIMDPVKTLIDSGSSRNFINITFARRHSLPLIELQHQRSVIGIDGQEIEDKIRFRTSITFTLEGKEFKQRFYAMPLGDTEAILGMTWLQDANPHINWEKGTLTYHNNNIQGKNSQVKNAIPNEFQEYAHVFSEEHFKKLPPHRGEFDCAINLKEGATIPKAARPIPLSNTLTLELAKHIQEE